MVLEYLVGPLKAEAHPKYLFFYGFLYASLGLLLSYLIFRDSPSLVMVSLTTMAAIPLIYNIIRVEEKKDLLDISEKNLLKEHSKAISVFMFYFLGATIAFAFWYCVLPDNLSSVLFRSQIDTVSQINSRITGRAFDSFRAFSSILSNNFQVLVFCILFSFLYGIGSVYILTWNASVVGFAIGNTIKTKLYELGSHTTLVGTSRVSFLAIYTGLFRYAIHGIPEILAYFVAGLAGGIISTAAIRHDFGTKKYVNIIMDSSILLLISLGILVFSAWLEVYITPIFF
jgi:uncharacterized membrane protein SpoIIM required for sporulation